jgi:UDP-N-acetylmuramoylalanine--D-glutamate ligase
VSVTGARRVLVVGASRSGVAAAAALRRMEPGTSVRVADRGDPGGDRPAGVEWLLHREDDELLADVDLVVKSPGIPADAPPVRMANAAGIPVWSEVELGYRWLEGRNPIVGVTGTNGKTTTTELCAAMLERGGVPAVAAGNIGHPLTALAGVVEPGRAVVCELSSFQLEDVHRLRCHVAVLLNVTPDHLDRHGTFEAYAAAKLRIFERQEPGDAAVLNDGDPWVSHLASTDVPGEARRIRISPAPVSDDAAAAFEQSGLRGPHNLENALCAAAAAQAAGADRDGALQALAAFHPGPHRLEEVAVIDGVRYVDDSKATNVEAAMRAMRSFDAGVHLILGGSRKGGGFDALAHAVDGRVAGLYLIGESADDLARALDASGRRPFTVAVTLDRAVALARASARPGDTVLLSPACASFDQFRDYADRGDAFRRLVLEGGS